MINPEANDLNTRDEEQTSEAQIPEETIQTTRIQQPEPTQQSLPFLLKENKPCSNINLFAFTTLLTSTVQIVSIYYYTQSDDFRYLFIPVVLDILQQAISIPVYARYPMQFRILGDSDLSEAVTREKRVLAAKCMIFAILFTNSHIRWSGLPILMVLVVFWVRHLEMGRNHRLMFPSVVRFVEGTALILLTVKLNTRPDMSWNIVMIVHLSCAWFLVVLSFITVPVLICTIGYKLSKGIPSISWPTLSFLFSSNVYVLASTMLIFELRNHLKGQGSLFSPYTTTVILIFVSWQHNLLLILLRNTSVELNIEKSENEVHEKTNLNYVMNVIKKSPTLFVTGNEDTLTALKKRPSFQESEHTVEEPDCIVCYTNRSCCLVMPCMHSGLCKSCAHQCLKKKSTCLICRQNIQKIVVIQKKSDTEYVVNEELTL